MHRYKTNIIISWVFLAFAITAWTMLETDYFVWKILFFFAILPRLNTVEKKRIESLIGCQSSLAKLGFVYMLGWLAYILFVYFNNPGGTEQILSDTQLFVFVAPIIVIFVISELKWFLSCNMSNSR